MSDSGTTEQQHDTRPSTRKRNIILALILAAAVLVMYVSIFYRLSVNPLE